MELPCAAGEWFQEALEPSGVFCSMSLLLLPAVPLIYHQFIEIHSID